MTEAQTASEAHINVQGMRDHMQELGQAMTDKAHSLAVLPVDCTYQCTVVVGSDGKPAVQCGIVCG